MRALLPPMAANELEQMVDLLVSHHPLQDFLQEQYSRLENVTIRLIIQTEDATFEEKRKAPGIVAQTMIKSFQVGQHASSHSQFQNRMHRKGSISKSSFFAKSFRNTRQLTRKSIDFLELKKYFGVPLEDIVEKSTEHSGVKMPQFLHDLCGALLKASGEEGLFRVSGNQSEVEELRNSIDRGEKVDFTREKNYHALSSLLKLYLRQLPDPLITPEVRHKMHKYIGMEACCCY